MKDDKTIIARKLRELPEGGECDIWEQLHGGGCHDFRLCSDCRRAAVNALADAIEAELAVAVAKEKREAMARAVGASIASNLYGKPEPQLPEGIEWPRFDDGELVKFGDEVYIPECDKTGKVDKVHLYGEEFVIQVTTGDDWFCSPCESYGTPVKRPEPEVLDADTQEALRADMELGAWDYLKKHGVVLVRKEGETKKEHRLRVRLAHREHLCERQRKLMGGE